MSSREAAAPPGGDDAPPSSFPRVMVPEPGLRRPGGGEPAPAIPVPERWPADRFVPCPSVVGSPDRGFLRDNPIVPDLPVLPVLPVLPARLPVLPFWALLPPFWPPDTRPDTPPPPEAPGIPAELKPVPSMVRRDEGATGAPEPGATTRRNCSAL